MRDDATDLHHIPGEGGPPIVHRTFAYLRDPWGFDDALVRDFGAVARTRLLGRTIILAASAELADELLIDREQGYSSTNGWGHILGELFPGGLMLRDFDDHQRHRKILRAAFTRPARQGYHAAINHAFARTLDDWAAQPTLEFYPAIKRALLEQATQAFLGLDENTTAADQLLRWFADIIGASIAVIRRRVPGSAWRRGLAARDEFDGFLRAEIRNRRGTARQDLFSRLCNAEDPDSGARFDDDDIVQHMIFVLFAAHDTTASGLTALFDQLTAAPELLEGVSNECRGLEPEADGGLGWDQLDAVPIVERSFREALRVTPPVPYILRRTVRECSLAQHALPARAPVTVMVRSVHNDPQLWPDPLRFDPDRFDPAQGPVPTRQAWIPFGAGAHRCVGADLAMQQAKVFCYQFVRRFDIERVSPAPSKWRQIPLPKPVDGLPLRLHPR